MADDRNWDFHLRILTASTRDSNFATDPSSEVSLLESVRKLHEFCKAQKSDDLVARVYPAINKLFQRAVASIPQSRSSIGLLLMAILQFFLDFGEGVLHDSDPSLRTFFKSCLSREFADPAIAEATIQFLIANRKKLERTFLKIFPTLVSPGSFLQLFPSIVDLPILVVALERVEQSSGSLVGGSIASIQKSTAPEMLLALMDEAYTGSTIADGGGDSESEDSSTIDVADPSFVDLLKDENDGIVGRHWTSPAMAAAFQAAVSGTKSDRLKESLKTTPHLLDVYFAIALRDVNDSLICALIPSLMSRNSALVPDKVFCYEIRKRLLEFMLAAFQRSPNFVAVLKKPIMDRLGEAYDGPEKLELALQLCWAIGEHGGGGESHKDAARELFESMELLLYENLSSSRLGLRQDSSLSSSGPVSKKSSQSRLLCFVVTAIAKLATYHRELLPRARVSLAKVASSRMSDERVWTRARDYLGLMSEPAICLSVLGPSQPSRRPNPDLGTVNWTESSKKMIAHVPFHILGGLEGPPFHDFLFSDILPDTKSA